MTNNEYKAFLKVMATIRSIRTNRDITHVGRMIKNFFKLYGNKIRIHDCRVYVNTFNDEINKSEMEKKLRKLESIS